MYGLRANKHHCQYLQNVFNKCGEDSFVFEILEVTSKKKRIEVEQKYLNEHFEDKLCTNSHPIACKHIAESVGKEALKRIYGRKKALEERAKISKSLHGNKNGGKIRFYDPRLSNAKELFLQDTRPCFIIFDSSEKEKLVVDAKMVYSQWPYYVKNNPQKTKKRSAQRIEFKNWLIEQDLWYDARSDSWERKKDSDKKIALQILKNQRNKKHFQEY